MIRCGLSEAIAVYLFIIVGVLLIAWLRMSGGAKKAADHFNAADFIQRCPYCGHVHLDYKRLDLIVCPVCESYFEGGQYGASAKS